MKNDFYFLKGERMAQIDPAATALVLISSALVFIMTPGLAFFYGGLVRRKMCFPS
jgi:ammonia channel protein AmtB